MSLGLQTEGASVSGPGKVSSVGCLSQLNQSVVSEQKLHAS